MYKKSIGEKIFGVFNVILMLLLCVITLYPYLNQIAISLNDSKDTAFGGITIWPRKFVLINYVTVLSNPDIMDAANISVLRVIAGTVLAIVVTMSAAYALARRQLPGRKAFIFLFMIPMFIHAGLIPTFMLFRNLKLIDSFLVYVIPSAFSFYNMIIMRTFIEGLPESLEESAIIDGANEVRVFFSIIFPLCMPVIATVALWVSVMHWNDWTTTLMFITRRSLYPLQYIMMQVVKESEAIQKLIAELNMSGGDISNITSSPESIKSATLIITTLPIIAVYPFLQKYFVKGIMIGSVKG